MSAEDFAPLGGYGIPGPQGERGLTGTGSLVWVGAWNNMTAYAVNDTVSHQGSSYTTQTPVAAGSNPPPSAPWELVAQRGDAGPQGTAGVPGLFWRGDWASSNAYVEGDAVYYAATGSTYRTTASVIGTAPTGAPWVLLAHKGDNGTMGIQGIQGPQGPQGTNGSFISAWRGPWLPQSWPTGSIVVHGGSAYVATGSTAGPGGVIEPPNAPWMLVVQGFPVASDAAPMSWVGAWSGTRTYTKGEVVAYTGKWWVTSVASTTATPGSGSDWAPSS